jgi:hypothetical protein
VLRGAGESAEAIVAFEVRTKEKATERRAEGPNRANRNTGRQDEQQNEAEGRDNFGRHPRLANDGPHVEGAQPVGVFYYPATACARRKNSGESNRRMRKTARPVVWEGAGAQSPAPDPIGKSSRLVAILADTDRVRHSRNRSSADFQSAVSPTCSRQAVGRSQTRTTS